MSWYAIDVSFQGDAAAVGRRRYSTGPPCLPRHCYMTCVTLVDTDSDINVILRNVSRLACERLDSLRTRSGERSPSLSGPFDQSSRWAPGAWRPGRRHDADGRTLARGRGRTVSAHLPRHWRPPA